LPVARIDRKVNPRWKREDRCAHSKAFGARADQRFKPMRWRTRLVQKTRKACKQSVADGRAR
jgi:hypothetical protein